MSKPMTRWQRRVDRIWWRGFDVGVVLGLFGGVGLAGIISAVFVPSAPLLVSGTGIPAGAVVTALSFKVNTPAPGWCMDGRSGDGLKGWPARKAADGGIDCVLEDKPK